MIFEEKKPEKATPLDCLELFYEKVRRGHIEKDIINYLKKINIDIFNVKNNQTKTAYINLLIAL